MESSPSYSSEDRGTSRDSKERAYQPSPPAESMFIDPRREEAPRVPIRTPLEGVIHIRPESGSSEAAQTHQAQQFEMAERGKDKDDKRDERRASEPAQVEPTTPVERPSTDQTGELTIDHADTERPTTEDERRVPEQAAPYYAEQPVAEQQEDVREDAADDSDGIQRAWYYTPPHPGEQPEGQVDQRSPALRAFEAAMSGEYRAATSQPVEVEPVAEAPAPAEYWQQPAEAPQPVAYAPEVQPVQVPAEADVPRDDEAEPAAWHYDSEQAAPLPEDQPDQQPAPYAPTYEASQDNDTTTTTSTNPLFGARTPAQQSQYQQYAAAGMPSFGGGPNNPNTPNVPPSGPGGGFNTAPGPYNGGPSYNQYPSAGGPAGAPSARLERLLRTEGQHNHRGLALGIVGGLLLEHHLAKNRDKKLSERIDKLQKENNQAQEQAYWANQETQKTQQAFKVEQQRTQEEIAKLREPQAESPAYAPTTETRADVSGSPLYAAAAAAGLAAAPNMAPRPTQQPEQRAAAPQTVEQQPGADPNQQTEYVDQQGNPIQLRPGERVKQSAWHTYVEKDGHVVEGAIDYGQGFRQEQQQELGRVQQLDSNQAGAQQGQTYAPTGQPGMYGAVNPSLPSGMTTPSLPMGQPTHADAQHQLPETTKSGKQVASNFANPWFWLMLALIFAAFFITVTV